LLLLNKAASFINDQLRVLGVVEQNEATFLGAAQNEIENALQPVLDVIVAYRAALTALFRAKAEWRRFGAVTREFAEAVRALQSVQSERADFCALVRVLVDFDGEMAEVTEEKADGRARVLKVTDALRDVKLPRMGVKIEDLEGANGSIWKVYEREELLAMLQRDGEAAEERRKEKARNRVKHLEKELEQWRKKSVAPREYLESLEDAQGKKMYSEFDAEGMPAKDGDGKALSKGKRKKLPKLVKKQQAAHKKYLEKMEENDQFIIEMETELKQAQSEL